MSAIKNISLYIPHVFPNFDKEYVARAFNNIGEVSQIDFVAKQDRNGSNFNAVYVHFNKWYTNNEATAFYDSVIDDTKQAQLTHDNKWYWIVLPNTAKKYVPGDRKQRLDLGQISTSNIAPTLFATPVKASATEKVCPCAPMKRSYTELQAEFEAEMNEIEEMIDAEDEMDEIEEMIDAEDETLVSIDGRYVQGIEEENWSLRAEIARLRGAILNLEHMYNIETAKVRAFSCAYA
jgi:hypothetical protein